MIQWYYRAANNQKVGPISACELKERVGVGIITETTRVWRSGLVDWTTYGALVAHDHRTAAAAEASAASQSSLPQSGHTATAVGASMEQSSSAQNSQLGPGAHPAAGALEECPVCHERMASHLISGEGGERRCGFCVQKNALRAQRERLGKGRGPGADWLSKHILKVAGGAIAIAIIRMILLDRSIAPAKPKQTLPTAERFPAAAQAH